MVSCIKYTERMTPSDKTTEEGYMEMPTILFPILPNEACIDALLLAAATHVTNVSQ